jgi:HTH-type transcriptional regulator/antitoxin HigA
MPTTAQTNDAFAPDYAVPPGDTIADLLDQHDMSQTELARRLGASLKHINQIVKGSASVSPDVALGLEKVLGPSANVWLTREAHYQAQLARQREQHELADCVPWASKFPITELKKRDFVPRSANGAELVAHLLRFLGVARPEQWADPTVAFRKSQKFESDAFALSAWLRQGEIEASTIDCAPYENERFLDVLQDVRELTRRDPEDWGPELIRLCATAGVAVVIVEAFPRARANGATRWLTPTKALIQLSLRHKWEDIFWFSFFHEAGHVALHRKKETFLESVSTRSQRSTDSTAQRLEEEADRFATRTLIPAVFDRRLHRISPDEIEAFAGQIGIAPAIVVGRLQHEKVLTFSQCNHLRRLLSMAEEE